MNYSIKRNNKNNQVKNEVSIFIGDNNVKINKNFNEKNNRVNNRNNNNRMEQFAKNKKTIINVNQYYSSYFIKK